MANFIDIKEFDGVLTNADIEDLPDNVAQEIKNLKIQAGKLEKTFGAGTASGIPSIGLTFVNDSYSPSKAYTVHNIFTFVSDKFEGDVNDAGDGYRYLLVTVEATDQSVKLWWWDSSLPDVTDHLQVEDDIIWFQTATPHGITVSDQVLVQDIKDNASPQASITSGNPATPIGVYKSANVIPSTTKVGINTDTAQTWGGSFFSNTLATGASAQSFGGKHNTHLLVSDTVSYGGTAQNKIVDIAIASMNGMALSLMIVDASRTNIVTNNGSSTADLSQTNYNSYKTKTDFKVCSMLGFNNAVYVHYTYTDGSPAVHYNPLVKYTCSSGGTISESVVNANLSTTALAPSSFMHIANGSLYLLINSNALVKVSTGDGISTVSTGSIPLADFAGLTSITSTNTINSSGIGTGSDVSHKYLIIIRDIGSRFFIYTNDILDSSNTTWTQYATSYAGTFKGVESTDFSQNSSRSESIVIHYLDSSNDTKLVYSTHTDGNIINGFSDVNTSFFATGTDIEFIGSTYNSPGSKYLIVGTDDNAGSPIVHGKLYTVSSSIGVKEINVQASGDKTNWNPTCFADCVTETHGGHDFFKYAKGYIGVYGTSSEVTSGTPAVTTNSADLYRLTDIGWLTNTWNGSGDCEYRWIDVTSKYDIPALYHKKDRNPIIPFGDTLRVLPGNIAKVGSNEAKGAWLGYIDRSLFNGNTVYGPAFFAEANRLTNPFTFKTVELKVVDEEVRQSDIVKYTVTAVYDGVQETQINDESIKQVVSNTGDNDDVSKSEIKLVLNLPISTMSKRITGINVYRAEKLSNVYETYKLITSYNFVDTGDDTLNVTTSADTELVMNFEVFNDKTIFVKDQDNAIKNWLNDGSTGNVTNNVGGITDNDKYDWDTGYSEFAIKVGSFEKQKIETVDAITGYEATGATLNEDLTSTDTTITVNNASGNVVQNGTYRLGFRDLTVDDTQGSEDDDAGDYEKIYVNQVIGNDLQVTRGYPNYTISGVSYTNGGTTITHSANGSITVGHIMTGPAGIPSGAMIVGITNSTNFVIDIPVTASQSSQTITALTNAKEHSKYAPIKAEDLSVTGWYKITTDDNMNGRFHNESWKMYREKFGPGWNTIISTKSEGAFAGKYMGIIMPQPSEDSNGDFTMAPWRDTDGTMKINSIVGQKFTATKPSTSSSKTLKIEKAYTTFDEQLGFTMIEVDKGPQSGNWNDSEVIISTFSDVSAVVSADLNEISIIDKGLSSLGEHPYAQETKIKINAQYAKILKGRLFLGNIVLDPGNENEVQNDWVAYSELNAYDVRPVSNVIPFPDREGGQITGLSELFGRLIVFKAQAIFVLDVVNPSSPTSWVRKESKINIGNIAPEGIVEVHDSVYFVHHDGIYRLESNTVASSDATPSVMDKITLGIEDQFLLATDKKSIKGVYDQKNNEILYTWQTGSPATQEVWAYHITLKTWREVNTSTNLDILTFGENSGPVAWDNTDTDVKKFDVPEAVGIAWKSKRFRLDLDQKKLLRYGMVKFTGTDTLTVNIYLDGAGSVSFTKDITADGGVNRFPIKRYGKNFEIELTTPSSTNVFSVERMRIETE